jgi:acyl-CoA thioester hydrolase
VAAIQIYRTAVQPEWIDYNGHLRDAYYALILSFASDALMDRLGMHAAYRAASGNTLYTVEMHIHYLREIHHSETLLVGVQLLAADRKRIHAGFEISCESRTGLAATAEFMLLHVHQAATVSVCPFEPAIAAAIEPLLPAANDAPWPGPGSRQMALRGR